MSDRGHAGEELETARLSLRRPTAADIDAIFAIQGDLRACHHNPSDRLTQREEAEKLYCRWNDQWERCGYGYWVVGLSTSSTVSPPRPGARVRPANVASQRVAVRVGLTRAEHLDTAGDDGLDWIFAPNLIKATALPWGW